MAQDLFQTAFWDFEAELNAEFANWYGWQLPRSFGDIKAEQEAVLQNAAVNDHGDWARFRVHGTRMAAELDKLLVAAVSALPVGGVQYNVMLSNPGRVLGAMLVLRMAADDSLLLVPSAVADVVFERLDAQLGEAAELDDLSDDMTQCGVIGASALTALPAAWLPGESAWHKYTANEINFIVAQLDGQIEILTATANAGKLLETLINDLELPLAGFEAAELWRLTNRQPACGSEIAAHRLPGECGLGDWVEKNAAERDFAGSMAVKNATPEHQLLYAFCGELRKNVKPGCPVRVNNKRQGMVVSCAADVVNGTVLSIISVPSALKISAGDGILIETEKQLVPAKAEIL